MTNKPPTQFVAALQKAVADLGKRDPLRIARSSGAEFQGKEDRGEFRLRLLDRQMLVTYPGGEVRDATTGARPTSTEQLLVLHYLITANGVPPQGRWIAFRELPSGLLYDSAFQGDTRPTIAYTFAHDRAGFEQACTSLGGEPLPFPDAAFQFRVLPRLPMAVILRLADDEFPADAQVLFDSSAPHYLPLEDLAASGEWLAQRIAAAKSRPSGSPAR